MRLTVVNGAARTWGLFPGMMLTDARAIHPGLRTEPAESERDAAALERLARWCERYGPWVALDAEDGIWIDVTGCAHLFGGETRLLEDLSRKLSSLTIRHRLGLAETPGAAWAVARFSHDALIPPGKLAPALRTLPVAGLRLSNDALTLLRRLGLTRIGLLGDIPRAALERRFRSREAGDAVLLRLDQAFGRVDEPLSPMPPRTRYQAEIRFSEPIQHMERLEAALCDLSARLCGLLARDGRGARHLNLDLFRVDGLIQRRGAGASSPTQDPEHIARLFKHHLTGIDAGFGIDLIRLSAPHAASLDVRQTSLRTCGSGREKSGEDFAQLIDRLSSRLPPGAVTVSTPCNSHIPERAEHLRPALHGPPCWVEKDAPLAPRPLFILDRPEPIEVMAEIPDGPPLRFRWRRVTRRAVRAEGPERIAPEWWRDPGGEGEPTRDYYRVEDDKGQRFWLFRSGFYQDGERPPQWLLHGFFP